MGKRKMTPAQKAAARRSPDAAAAGAARGGSAEIMASRRVGRNLDTARERLTRRIFTTVQVVLVIFPFALLGYVSMAGMSLQDAFGRDPGFTVSFLAAMAQPFVAWLIRIGYRHYSEGDGGYALGNLIGLLCAEALMQNVVGVAGCAVALWRLWRPAAGELTEWKERRGLGGVLFDISGAIVVLAIAAICAFASWRISLAG